MPIKNLTKRAAATLVAVAAAAFATPLAANTVIEWNQLAGQVVAGPPFSQLRQYAMVHVAMADAVVAVEGRYEPFKFDLGGAQGGSASAAAAQAAHDVLAGFFSPATCPTPCAALATIGAKLRADLAALPPGLAKNGAAAGKKSAAMVLVWRATDGFAARRHCRPPRSCFQRCRVSGGPTASGAATFSTFGEVEPFATLSSTQFLHRPRRSSRAPRTRRISTR